MVTNAYLKALSESAGFWWTDTAVMQAMDQDIENGATGVTTNPVLVKASLYKYPDYWRPFLKSAEGLSGDAKAEEIIKEFKDLKADYTPMYQD